MLLFPPETWNHFESEVGGKLGRTNNAQEGFHKELNKRFSGASPPLSKVITILKSEDLIGTEKLRPYLLDPTKSVTLHKRNPTYVANDLAINRLILGYSEITDPTDEQIIAFLFAVQSRLGQNNFNHWDD